MMKYKLLRLLSATTLSLALLNLSYGVELTFQQKQTLARDILRLRPICRSLGAWSRQKGDEAQASCFCEKPLRVEINPTELDLFKFPLGRCPRAETDPEALFEEILGAEKFEELSPRSRSPRSSPPTTCFLRAPEGFPVPSSPLSPGVRSSIGSISPLSEILDPSYLAASQPYKTIPVIERYITQDRDRGVKYFDEHERGDFLVEIRDGRLFYKKSGLLISANREGGGVALPPIYVMDGTGNLYIYPGHHPGKINHSSLLAGAPVSSAGEIWLKDGKILGLNNLSGHYQPRREYYRQVLRQLRRSGIDIESIPKVLIRYNIPD